VTHGAVTPRALALSALAVTLGLSTVAALGRADAPAPPASATPHALGPTCAEGMARVALGQGDFCVDRFEAHLERLDDAGQVVGVHPPNKPVYGKRVRAKSAPGASPQAYVSADEAASACREAGKRLCSDAEWQAACRGAAGSRYPYGERWRRGACNDRGVSPLGVLEALGPGGEGVAEAWGHQRMTDPRLYLVPGGVARTGRFERCQTEEGVYDMVGNLHEWTADEQGTFRGGYYLDTETLGPGCDYAATGHDRRYSDYSTGFRCCAALAP
jgi:sulfatase modifying factor 1